MVMSAGGSAHGSAASSPLRLPSVDGDDDEDEMYRDMVFK